MSTITITLPDGSHRTYDSGVTGQQIAASIGRGLAKDALAVSIDGEVRDLARPITADAELKICTWKDDEAKRAFWHSSAHLMAEAVESLFPGAKFGVGPAIDTGFYYDIDLGDHNLDAGDLARIEKRMGELASRDSAYTRETIPWADAVRYFEKKGDQYKLELLEGLKDEEITFYHHGGFTDLCAGPHIPSTGRIKAIKLLSVAGAYWRGNEKNRMLQRKKAGPQEVGTGAGTLSPDPKGGKRASALAAKRNCVARGPGGFPPRRATQAGIPPGHHSPHRQS
jgi:threonyl-tRNA synthetase